MSDGTKVLLKLIGLCMVAGLTAISNVIGETGKYDYWPSWPRIVWSVFLGAIAIGNVFVAFSDGSFVEWKNKDNEAPKGEGK